MSVLRNLSMNFQKTMEVNLQVSGSTNDAEIKDLVEKAVEKWGKIDGIVHSVDLLQQTRSQAILKNASLEKASKLPMI